MIPLLENFPLNNFSLDLWVTSSTFHFHPWIGLVHDKWPDRLHNCVGLVFSDTKKWGECERTDVRKFYVDINADHYMVRNQFLQIAESICQNRSS